MYVSVCVSVCVVYVHVRVRVCMRAFMYFLKMKRRRRHACNTTEGVSFSLLILDKSISRLRLREYVSCVNLYI